MEGGDDGGVVRGQPTAHSGHNWLVERGARLVPGDFGMPKYSLRGSPNLLCGPWTCSPGWHNALGRVDARALGQFVEASYDEVFRFCANLVSEKVADDLCQETFARAIRPCQGSAASRRLGRGCSPAMPALTTSGHVRAGGARRQAGRAANRLLSRTQAAASPWPTSSAGWNPTGGQPSC